MLSVESPQATSPQVAKEWKLALVDFPTDGVKSFKISEGGPVILKLKWIVGGLVFLAIATPVRADFCFQLNGGSFSGDLGFFRFEGKRPTSAGKIVKLTGRVAGLSPVFGTATVAKDASFSEFGATFFADAVEGQFDVSFFPPKATSGSGSGAYGSYGLIDSLSVSVVDCSTEP